jgi:hypothetical protein
MIQYIDKMIKIFIYIFTFSLLFISCREKISIRHNQSELNESVNRNIENFPSKMYFHTDSSFLIQNSLTSILEFDLNGLQNNIQKVNLDIHNLLKYYNYKHFNDSTISFDLAMSNNNYFKGYPILEILNFDIHDNSIFYFCIIANPIILDGKETIDELYLIIKEDMLNGQTIDSFFIDNSFQNINEMAILPKFSFFQYNDSSFFSYALKLNEELNSEVILLKSIKSDIFFKSDKSYHFPYSKHLVTQDTTQDFNYPFQLPVCLKEINNQILYSNAVSIYNIENGKKLFSVEDFYDDDSLRALLSYDILMDGDREHIVFVESILPNHGNFDDAEKYLNILSSNKKRILYRKYLGRKVSWVEVRNNTAYILTEGKEHIYLEKFKVIF